MLATGGAASGEEAGEISYVASGEVSFSSGQELFAPGTPVTVGWTVQVEPAPPDLDPADWAAAYDAVSRLEVSIGTLEIATDSLGLLVIWDDNPVSGFDCTGSYQTSMYSTDRAASTDTPPGK